LWGETSEEGGREAGFLADQIEPADDSGLGASAFPGDLSGAEGLNAVQAKDFGDGRGWPAPAGIEFLQQDEGGTGDAFGGRSRLRGGLKWELAGGVILIFDINHGESLPGRREGVFYVDRGLYIERLGGGAEDLNTKREHRLFNHGWDRIGHGFFYRRTRRERRQELIETANKR